MKIKMGTMLIGTSDLTKARDFYSNVFGLTIEEFRPPFMQANLGEIEFNIEEDADYRSPGWAERNIGTRKSFTFEVDDIFSFIEHAKKYGAKIISEPIKQEWGWYDAVIADFDGNEFVIEQEVK